MRKLYIENKQSANQIATLTGWSVSSIKRTLIENNITRSRKSSHNINKYGWKMVNGTLVHHKGQQKIIEKIKNMITEKNSFIEIARKLNKNNVPSTNGGTWNKVVISNILAREK